MDFLDFFNAFVFCRLLPLLCTSNSRWNDEKERLLSLELAQGNLEIRKQGRKRFEQDESSLNRQHRIIV